jgi:hypothetical protein
VTKATNRPPATAWQSRDIADWNVTTYHAFLIDENKRRFNALYTPFGRGNLNTRWATEKGMIKQAQGAVGNAVLKRFIERCLDAHRPKPDFPHVNFGFMWSYLRDELPRAQSDIAQAQAVAERRADAVEVDSLDNLI